MMTVRPRNFLSSTTVESAERAKVWLNSPEYRTPRQLRYQTTKTNMVVVEGV